MCNTIIAECALCDGNLYVGMDRACSLRERAVPERSSHGAGRHLDLIDALSGFNAGEYVIGRPRGEGTGLADAPLPQLSPPISPAPSAAALPERPVVRLGAGQGGPYSPPAARCSLPPAALARTGPRQRPQRTGPAGRTGGRNRQTALADGTGGRTGWQGRLTAPADGTDECDRLTGPVNGTAQPGPPNPARAAWASQLGSRSLAHPTRPVRPAPAIWPAQPP